MKMQIFERSDERDFCLKNTKIQIHTHTNIKMLALSSTTLKLAPTCAT